MDRKELASAVGFTPDELNDFCHTLAGNPDAWTALQQRVNIHVCTGRCCNEKGDAAEDPTEPLKIRMVKDFGDQHKVGEVKEVPYRDGVTLTNTGFAELVHD